MKDWQIKKRLEKRAKLTKAHEEGTLSNSYYTKDKKTGKKVLSPHKLYKEFGVW